MANPDFLESGYGGVNVAKVNDGLYWLRTRETMLWGSALTVTLLALAAFLLSNFPELFTVSGKWYSIRQEQVIHAVLCLLLLFNSWLVYRLWLFRSWRKKAEAMIESQNSGDSTDPTSLDAVTGLYTKGSIEAPLGKEIGRVKRENIALSFLALHLDNLPQLTAKHGQAASIQALKEFARALRKASRGSDFAARMGDEDFLLVLPECNAGSVKQVIDRIGKVRINCAGARVPVSYSTGWIDYQPGELPADLLKRAGDILKLYHHAGKEDAVALAIR